MKRHAFINNQSARQYELRLGDSTALVEYVKTRNGEMVLTHTEVPALYESQGIASELVENVLEDIRKNNMQVVPICPFIARYIHKHPQWKSLVVKGIEI